VLRALAIVVLLTAPVAAAPPELASSHAVVIDAATGAELFAKGADELHPIASMTKLFVALLVRQRHVDLDAWTTITDDDARAAEGGAGTRLLRGETFRNLDLLHAMLLVSDNRVPTALARSVGLAPEELVGGLGALAEDMGLAHTAFADATGIHDNQSTAREMALALRAALRDPVIARILRTRYARVVSQSEAVTIDYTSTVRPLWNRRFTILGGKTGHTEKAGYCLLIGAHIGTRSVVMALLGAPTYDARFDDFERLAAWLAERPE